MKEIEKTLGRIHPDSEEGKRAQLYIEALDKYPDLGTYYGILSLKELVKGLQYRTNILEKNARQAAKEYEPSLLKSIKVSFKEFISLMLQ